MLAFISCAKTMAARCTLRVPQLTTPRFEAEALQNALSLSQYSAAELETLLRVNAKIAAENRLRYGRFHGDDERANSVYQGIKPLTGEDIADVAYYAASAPAHVQIAEVLVLATHQASGSVVKRNAE